PLQRERQRPAFGDQEHFRWRPSLQFRKSLHHRVRTVGRCKSAIEEEDGSQAMDWRRPEPAGEQGLEGCRRPQDADVGDGQPQAGQRGQSRLKAPAVSERGKDSPPPGLGQSRI
ncbi:MAG: hypothetical protein QNJ06_13700, partial [Kiloniellales bacterium]|nr:hypothetical protein [Kiloniellales bacterium]